MCIGYLFGLLLIPLIISIYYVFDYRARYLTAGGNNIYLHELLNNFERELLEIKSKCRELEQENKELQRLNQVHELKTQVRQADLKRAV